MSEKSRHLFDADRFVDGFEEVEQQVPVLPDSPLGKAMSEARDGEPLDPDFRIVPIPVDD
jgi:hypothetical protein